MGKKKIEIEKIKNNERRIITFSKRRKGLFKKAAEICRLCDPQIAIIVFSPAGKVYSFGHRSVDGVIHRFLTGEQKEDEEENKNIKNINLHNQIRRGDGGGGFWWDTINIEELDSIEKLEFTYNAMLNLKENVTKRIKQLNSLSASPSSFTAAAAAAARTTSTSTTMVEDHSLYLREGDDFRWPSDDELANLDELANFRNDLFLKFRNDDYDMLKLHQLLKDQEDALPGSPVNKLRKIEWRHMRHIT